jgi:copper homeostasis protein CutC
LFHQSDAEEDRACDDPVVERLQDRAGDRLTLLAGGSVRSQNVCSLVAASGVREVHARGTDPNIVRDVVLALATRATSFVPQST